MTQQATPPPPPQAGAPGPIGHVEPAKTPSKAGGLVKRIVGVVIVFAVISIGSWAYKNLTGAPETAKVGDCLVGQSEDDLKVVECSDATAQYKVAGKVEDKTEAAFDQDAAAICEAYPNVESAYWWGKQGKPGDVLCLELVKK